MTSTSHPDRRRSLILFGVGVVAFSAAAALISAPGYMDAEYYFATAGELARGRGFSEPFIWNYLATPASLPAASHTYWQPLASLLAAAPLTIFGVTFRAAQSVSVLLAAAIPVLAAQVSASLGRGGRAAWVAGGLALLPGFFTPYLVTTDTFGIMAVIGGLLWWQSAEIVSKPAAWRLLLVGVLVGCGALARADGMLLWIPAIYLVLSMPRRLRSAALMLAGFGLLLVPWWLRNLSATGAVLGPGSSRALWLLSYDDLFVFPAARLTFERWWGAGLIPILSDRLAAASSNVQSVLAVNGYVVLLPLMAAGGWTLRREMAVRAGLLYGAVLWLVMSLLFPYAGARGGFFHSSAALMPLLYALAAAGIDVAGRWIAARLRWEGGRTETMLVVVSLCVAAALSLWALFGKAGFFGPEGAFERNRTTYQEAARRLPAPAAGSVAAVVDPPGFYLATGVSAVALPHGDEADLRKVVEQYGVDWIVLEADHPTGLDLLYDSASPRGWLADPITFIDPAARPVLLYRVLSRPE